MGIDDENGNYYIFIQTIDALYVYSLNSLTSLMGETMSINAKTWYTFNMTDNGPVPVTLNANQYPVFEGWLTYAVKDYDKNIIIESNQTLEAANEYYGEIFVLAQ